MPDFTTHYIFGRRVLSELGNNIQHVIKLNQESFNFGCQGPDLLFFSKVITGKSALPSLGNMMHRERNTDLLFGMADYIAQRKGKKDYYILLAYFFGFLCHYYSDKTCHPYVYYHEARMGKGVPAKEWSKFHCQIEADIDTQLYPYYMDMDINEFKPASYYQSSDVMKRSITAMYAYIFENVYNIKVSQKDIYACFKDILGISRLFYDNSGILRGVASAAETVTGTTKGTFTCHFKGRSPDWQVLNLSHSKWHSLWQPEVSRSESIPQLLDIAQNGAVKAIEQYYEMINNSDVKRIEYTECFAQGETDR